MNDQNSYINNKIITQEDSYFSKYWKTHDENFLKAADLKYFNDKILDLSLVEESEYIFNLIKDCPQNSSIIDVGAYVGDTSISLAQNCKAHGREDVVFHCFEPLKENCKKIEFYKNKYNLNINIYETAIHDSEKVLYMKSFDGPGTIYKEKIDNTTGNQFSAKNLDSFSIGNVFLCKIDVEGSEEYVLRGGQNTLMNAKYIYIEMWNDFHYINKYGYSNTKSHNIKILEEIHNINENLYPIQKIEKNILFENKSYN